MILVQGRVVEVCRTRRPEFALWEGLSYAAAAGHSFRADVLGNRLLKIRPSYKQGYGWA